MTKFKVRLTFLILIWTTVFMLLYLSEFTLFLKFFTIWGGITFTIATLIITHFHFKKWGPEIKEELEKHNLKLIDERPLTFFEMFQFMDLGFMFEIISFNFKQIIKVENRTKELCIRINKNIFSGTINEVEIIGEV